MRHDPTPGFSMLLFGVSLACYSPSLKSVQDQAYTAAVVLEGKVQSVSPPAGNGSGGGRDPPGSNGGVLVKVLDLWPLNSGGLQREQLISVGSAGSKAPCFKVKRNHRYIFFLEPTEKPLVFKTSFAPLDTSGKNLKKDVGRILCADCDMGGIPARSCPLLLQRERASRRFNFPKESCASTTTHLASEIPALAAVSVVSRPIWGTCKSRGGAILCLPVKKRKNENGHLRGTEETQKN
ncbi:hypothetical protein Y1Q_0004828 [Alligator mississippiensis]|uniref:Neuregulin 2 N-terminal domain-containing protein n=1 Tax=Alligator mississippiensis TaxID=8496 RepID=A0A151NQX6_ALLMI|nr:hypothetical protein Y1Q_0004828 [Alligator mississippiensis]